MRDAVAEQRLAKTAIEVREENAFDDRFDAFWDELRTRRPPILLGARTRAALQWHFEYPLRRKQAWVLTVSHGSRLIAYSIFYREDKADIGLKRVRLVDRQCLVDSVAAPAFDAMLARMLEICRREGVHMLEDVACTVEFRARPASARAAVVAFLLQGELAPHRDAFRSRSVASVSLRRRFDAVALFARRYTDRMRTAITRGVSPTLEACEPADQPRARPS